MQTAWLTIGCLVMAAASAGAADPRIGRLDPPGGQRGRELTLRIHGKRLAGGPCDLLFYETGIELLGLEPEKDTLKATLRLADDCQLGPHALRVRTPTGLSNLATLRVGDLPEVQEVEPNDAPGQATPVPFGSVVNGVVKREDTDSFAVEVEQGQRLSVEVEGLRIGRAFFDPALVLIGPDGEVVAESDDAPPTHQDPSLSLIAPASGEYVIRLRESAGRGGDDHQYRLHVGGFPRPLAVFPPAATDGGPAELRWLGPGAPDGRAAVALRGNVEGIAQAFARDSGGVSPTPLPVRVADRPVIEEAEPNNTPQQATRVTLPAAMVGVIGEAGDQDRFRFTAKKGEAWDLRVFARQLRSPLDSTLSVRHADGKQLAGNDDDQGKPDSYLRFKAPADGDYEVRIADHLGRGGPTHTYAIEASRPEPTAELTIHETRRFVSETINVPRGNRAAVLMNVKRANVGGPLDLALDGLPNGVRFEAPTLAGNYNRVPVVFSADESIPPAGALLTVTARRENDAPLRSVFLQQEWFVRGQNNVPVWSYFAERAPLAVTERAPFSVRLIEPRAPIVQNGSMGLRVVAERSDGFDEPILVRMLYHPPGVSSNRSRSIKKGETEAVIPVTTNRGARIGDWDIVVTAEAKNRGRTVVSSQLVKLRIAAPYFTLSLPRVSVVRGESIDYPVGIEPTTPFEGPARLELIGLPPGVTAPPVEVTADASVANFRVAVAADARTGRHRSIACRAVLTDSGEPVTHTLGGGELLIDPPAKRQTPSETAGKTPKREGAPS